MNTTPTIAKTVASITAAAIAAVDSQNPVTGTSNLTSHHHSTAEAIARLFHVEQKRLRLEDSLREAVAEARAMNVPERDILTMIKAAGKAAGISSSSISRALISAGLRQRAERSDSGESGEGEKEPLTAEKAEQSIKAILSGLPPVERAATAARIAAWAAA